MNPLLSTDVKKGPTGKQKPEISSSESLVNLFYKLRGVQTVDSPYSGKDEIL